MGFSKHSRIELFALAKLIIASEMYGYVVNKAFIKSVSERMHLRKVQSILTLNIM